MLALLFHEFGLTLVSLADLGSSLTEQGPSSMNSPRAELHPGPPDIIVRQLPGLPLYSWNRLEGCALARSREGLDIPLIHMMTGSSAGLSLDSKK